MKKTKMIETYLDGSMSVEEQKKFKALLSEDKDLSADVLFYKEVNEAITDDEVHNFRGNINALAYADKKVVVEKKVLMMKYLKYPVAATILALIGLSLFQILTVKEPTELYKQYYEPYHTDLTTRSAAHTDDKSQLSFHLYQEGNYEASFEVLSNYIDQNNDDSAANFYYALNAIELKKYDLAISVFLLLEEQSYSPFSLHAKWYLAMLYLKTDQPGKAKKYLLLLSEDENIYSEKASKIRKKLKS